MDDQLIKIRKTHLRLMQWTCKTLGHILSQVSSETASTLRDGSQGWTTLEVMGHLRDYDDIFYRRAVMMLEQDYPHLPYYDHEALAIERNYNGQEMAQVYAELSTSRQRFVTFFENLTPEEWARAGVHPERGHFTMTDALVQVGTHEANHIEQITRILREGVRG